MIKRFISVAMVAGLAAGMAIAETPLNYQGEVFGNAGNGDFAPYYMMSNNGGVLTQSKTLAIRLKAWKDFDLSERFSYSFGADMIGEYASATDYMQFDHTAGELRPKSRRPVAERIQQLYGELKYRGVFLSVGMKERRSPLFNSDLISGDFIQSGNARPLPEVRAGFVDFQNIPLTKGWVQILVELSFGKYTPGHNSWLEEHYNYNTSFINTGVWTHYKSMYFRTKPSERFSVTVGMQVYSQFGGDCLSYRNGKISNEDRYDVKLKDFWRVFVPGAGGDNFGDSQYVYGNTIGAWDILARYRLRNDSELRAYFQFPYEDGSGIGKLNGFDGIWGLEYKNADDHGLVTGAVVEYLDFTNQSGPTHWAPADNPGSTMTGEATGGDGYYNNFRYNSFMNYGLSQGSPFIPAIIYNKDGYMRVIDNRVRGFHVGVSGRIYDPLKYRLLVSYRKSWGSYESPRLATVDDTSFMLEGIYDFRQVSGLSLKGQVAFDRGSLLGDNFGVMLSLSYKGILNIFNR